MKSISLLLLISPIFCSYVPPYYEGIPTKIEVVTLDPPDFRGKEVFRIVFNLEAKSDMPDSGFIHRSLDDFVKFNHILSTHLLNIGLHFPNDPTLENLNSWMQTVAERPIIQGTNALNDFLGINWSGKDLKFMENIEEFMKIVIPALYRAPDFAPEPPVFTSELDTITSEETPFEIYTYLTAFRAKSNLEEYLEFFENFLSTCPKFDGLQDDSDVRPEGVSVHIPPHFNQTFVHFLPGGYLNGHTVRISFLGKSKFNFLHEELIKEWLTKLHGDKNPKRILDVGTGPGFSAFVLAEMFPESEVIAVDLAAPYIRMARMWQELRNVTNIKFYQGNGEDLSWLESDSFDLINYAYVLHEMPADNVLMMISEMYRLLRQGGTMNGFEVPFFENELIRETFVEQNTWGYHWDAPGPKGPEPYIEEYEYAAQLPISLESVGFSNIEVIDYSYFEHVFLAQK